MVSVQSHCHKMHLHLNFVNFVAFYWTTVCGEFVENRFRALCSAGEAIVNPNPMQTFTGRESRVGCGVRCREQPTCSAFQVIQSDGGENTCELFDCKAMPVCESSTKKAAAYYRVSTDRCPPCFIYEPSLASCYYVNTQGLPYFQAAARCLQYGAHLVAIESKEEQNFLASHLVEYDNDVYWTGGESNSFDMSDLSSWTWNLGSISIPMTYMNWYDNQPDSVGERTLYMNTAYGYKWLDIPYRDYLRWSVCEYNICN